MIHSQSLNSDTFLTTGQANKASAASRAELTLMLTAAAFVFVSAAALSLALEGTLQWRHFYAPGIWGLLFAFCYVVLARGLSRHDPVILPLVALMTGWGLILIDRLAPNFLPRQVVWLVIGCGALLLAAMLRPLLGFLRRYRYTWLTLGLLLLAATLLFGVNPSGLGATLWLRAPIAGQVYFQPSELLKLLLVVFLASYFAERGRIINIGAGSPVKRWIAYLAPLVIMWGFCMILLVWQRDLGAATLFFAVFVVLIYLATGDRRYVVGGLLLLLIAAVTGYLAYDVVALRVDTWIDPWLEADSRGFQIVQSLYAVAAGGVFGQGIGTGFPTYIPVVHSDFAFAAIAEEWGLIGAIGIVAGFTALAYRGLLIAGRSRKAFHLYLAAGITVLFSVQAFLIMAGVTKLLPLTGVTLPFVSYGGSSLLISCTMAGLLLSLSWENNRSDRRNSG
ncbi:MAG: FtsW/RodA/SpoVE family cell cycle protein [Chloroflexota bacterium]|nr:MAG: FtsW/RodA/SpoVE family cell cycle protein [Chloroflexota bacterium]